MVGGTAVLMTCRPAPAGCTRRTWVPPSSPVTSAWPRSVSSRPPPPPSRRPDILPFGPVSTCILGSQLVPCTRSSEAEPRGSQLGCTLYHQESLEKSPLSRLHPRPAPSGRAGAGGRTEALVFFFKFPRLANTRLALRPRDLGSLGGNGYDPVGGEGCKSRHVPCGLSSSVFGL